MLDRMGMRSRWLQIFADECAHRRAGALGMLLDPVQLGRAKPNVQRLITLHLLPNTDTVCAVRRRRAEGTAQPNQSDNQRSDGG